MQATAKEDIAARFTGIPPRQIYLDKDQHLWREIPDADGHPTAYAYCHCGALRYRQGEDELVLLPPAACDTHFTESRCGRKVLYTTALPEELAV
jgi:hypothetical protein